MFGLLKLSRIPLLLCSSDEEAYFGQHERKLELIVLQHDEHVFDFLLVNTVGPRKTFLTTCSVCEGPLQNELLLHQRVMVIIRL